VKVYKNNICEEKFKIQGNDDNENILKSHEKSIHTINNLLEEHNTTFEESKFTIEDKISKLEYQMRKLL
jgi:Txe/YoeB family toxin of Txe-Axe toxin-antitoxin module